MTPERWQRIEQVYFAALARTPHERAAWLDDACKGDQELRTEVESLLAAHQQGSRFLAEPALEVVAKKLAVEQSLAQAGQIINQYQILSPLGAGGMGVVYKALDLKLGRTVALKMLAPALVTDQTARLRLLREARAASMLAHPNICTVFEIGQSDDLMYIAMQYLQGKTLADWLSESPMPLRTALGYALDIADALEDAHRHGVIHRDIKPTNMIINERGRAVVLDFGLAKYIGARRTDDGEAPTLLQITEAMSPIGTPAYMSPEQVRGGALDERSDIFSFGVMLYEMATGIRPFSGQSQMDTLHAILYHDPPPPLELKPGISGRLNRLIKKTLAKAPDQRYPSFTELKADLATVLTEKNSAHHAMPAEPVSAGTTRPNAAAITDEAGGRPTAATPPLTARIRAAMASKLALAVLLLVVGLAAALWIYFGSRPQPEVNTPSALHMAPLVSWKSEPGEMVQSGSLSLGSFSPDGKMIAYCASKHGSMTIWVKQTIDSDPVQITKDEWSNTCPLWSPDGQAIAYVSLRGHQLGIWRIPAIGGGTPALIGEVDARDSIELKRWSKDGTTIYYDAAVKRNLFALNVESHQLAQVTHFDPDESGLGDITPSPDLKRIAYIAGKDGQSDVWVVPIKGGPAVRITNDPALDSRPIWHPDGKRIIYNSLRAGINQVCVAYLDGRPPQQITLDDRDSQVSDVPVDGTRLLYAGAREESDIWSVKLETGEENEVTSDPGSELWPDVAPDGKTLAYQFIREPGQGANLRSGAIFSTSIAGQRQRLQLAESGFNACWSPDGQRLAFLRFSDGLTNIWIVKPTSGEERQLTKDGVHFEGYHLLPYNKAQTHDYSWSPDGSRIVYCSTTPEAATVWVVSADGASVPLLLKTTGVESFICLLWSPDDQRIAGLSQSRVRSAAGKLLRQLWLIDAQTGKAEVVYQSETALQLLGWSASGDGVILAKLDGYLGQYHTDFSLIQVATGSGALRQVARLQSACFNNLQLSPDRHLVAFAARLDGKDNLWVIPVAGGQAKKVTSNIDPKLYFSSLAWSPDARAIYYGRQSKSIVITMIENFK